MQAEIFKKNFVIPKEKEKTRYNNEDIIAFVLIQFGINATIKDYFPDTGMIGFEFLNKLDFNTFIIELSRNEHLTIKMKESNTVWIKPISNKFIKQ